jgi:hypothetical protein
MGGCVVLVLSTGGQVRFWFVLVCPLVAFGNVYPVPHLDWVVVIY